MSCCNIIVNHFFIQFSMKFCFVFILIFSSFLSLTGQYVTTYDPQKEYNGYYKGKPESYYRDLAKKASKVKSAGILLTTAGTTGVITGALVISSATGPDSDEKEKTGAIILLSGAILMDVGIPLWIYGGIKKRNNLNAADLAVKNHTTSLYLAPVQSGIGLVCRF